MHKVHLYFFIFFGAGSLLIGCSDNNEEDPVVDDQQIIQDFIAADSTLTASLDESTGIWFTDEDSLPAGGPLAPGTIVEVYYTIRSLGGVVISIRDSASGNPAKMLYGADAIYPIGFDRALSLMEIGERKRFFIPHDLGYEAIEIEGLIPENAILDVSIELVNTLTEDEQLVEEQLAIQDYINIKDLNDIETPGTGIYIDRFNELDSGALVGTGEEVEITYVSSFLNGSTFDATFGNETFSFEFGRGEAIPGLELGLGEMFKGESAMIIIPSTLAYGGSVKVMPTLIGESLVERNVIPTYAATVEPYRTIIIEVTLLP